MQKSIFISYSSSDKDVAFDMVDFFEEKGIGCFIAPRDIEPGVPYASRLTSAIKECKAAILVASELINSSDHILNELDIIVSEKKFFVPFFVEAFDMSYEYRYYLGRKQRIMADTGKPQDHFCKLIDALQSEISLDISTPKKPIQEMTPALANNTQKVFSYIPHRGIMINPEDQQRNVSFRTDTLIGMLGGIYDEIVNLSSQENADKALRNSGYSCGKAFAQRLNSQWDLSSNGASLYEEKLRKWCQFDSDVGWGKFDIDVSVNEDTGEFSGVLTINECFIVDFKNKRHVCSFVQGYCAGVIETLLGIEVTLSCRVCPLKSRFKTACVFDILIKEE
jgi:predicted hydrocarbon binding protein